MSIWYARRRTSFAAGRHGRSVVDPPKRLGGRKAFEGHSGNFKDDPRMRQLDRLTRTFPSLALLFVAAAGLALSERAAAAPSYEAVAGPLSLGSCCNRRSLAENDTFIFQESDGSRDWLFYRSGRTSVVIRGDNGGLADVNSAGQVAGTAGRGEFAFIWTETDGVVDLGSLGGDPTYAAGLDEAGQVIGRSTNADGHERAFLWTAAEGMIDLGTLGGSDSRAIVISETGQIAGQADDVDGNARAFLWTPADGMIDLGTLGGPTSIALAISDGGQVVGRSDTADGRTHAFSWTADTGMIDLGALGGSSSTATDVNEVGEVTGYWREEASSDTRVFYWSMESGMLDIGAEPRFVGAEPSGGINDAGVILGSIDTEVAFYWSAEDGLLTLSDLVTDDELSLGDGISINESGSVLAYGFSGLYLLRPTDDVVPVADGDGDGVPDAADLCPGTVLGIEPSEGATRNRFYSTASGTFVDGRGEVSGIRIGGTGGCSDRQITVLARLPSSNLRYGLWEAELLRWADAVARLAGNGSADADADADGVADARDLCPATVLGIEPTERLAGDRYYSSVSGLFIRQGAGDGPEVGDTGGCSAQQIIAEMRRPDSDLRYGLKEEDLQRWVAAVAALDIEGADADGDGVADDEDVCPATELGIAPTVRLTKNRYYSNVAGQFVDDRATLSEFDVADTGGCSTQQIVAAAGLADSNLRYGLWDYLLQDWVEAVRLGAVE